MADELQEYQITYKDKPPFNSVAACSKNEECPIASDCLRAIVWKQQGWFGSWITPEHTGNDCTLIITEKKRVEPAKERPKPIFKFREPT